MTVVERADVYPVLIQPGGSAVFGPVDTGSQFCHVLIFGIGLLRLSFPDRSLGLVAVFHNGHQDIRIAAGNCQTNSSQISLWNPLGQLDPGLTRICGFINTAIWSAGIEPPGLTESLPETNEEDIRIFGVHDEVDGPGFPIIWQPIGQFLPGLSSISGLEQTSVSRVAPGMSGRSSINCVWRGRMRKDAGDRVRAF